MGVNEVVPLLNIEDMSKSIDALWVTSVADPDGHRLDFESPTDLPEETKLSEAV